MARSHLPVLALAALSLCTRPAAARPRTPAHAGTSAGSASAVLPLRHVRLYESGVGYFERRGVLARGSVGLPVPAGHLDDALESLVVLGAGGGTKVSGIEFKSSVSRSMALAMAGLSGDGSRPLGYQQLLRTLKGAAVQLDTPDGSVRGRLIDVLEPSQSDLSRCIAPAHENAAARTPKPRDESSCVLVKQSTLLVLTDKHEIRRFALADVSRVRPTDPAVASRLEAALGALSGHRAQTRKLLRVSAVSRSPITLGYIAEAPIWRSTYRVVLDKNDNRGVLQGWALVHNDTDEDWKRVTVDLVNGRPASFLFPLASPRYAHRKLVTPERQMSSVPQLLDTTVDNMWSGEDGGGAGGLALTGIGEGGGGEGEGIGLGSIGSVGYGAGRAVGASVSSLLSVGNLAAVEPAGGAENGALFRYTLPHPIDLHAHSSALVPFMQGKVPAERIAWFSAPGATAQSALKLTNKTRQTLPPGPVAVFADGGFAGESALSRTRSSEVRFLRFGLDLDVELRIADQTSKEEPRLFSFSNDHLVEHYLRHRVITYDIEDRSQSGRAVYLVLDVVNNAHVTGADSLDFDRKSNRALAVFHIGAHKKLVKTLEMDEGLSRSRAFSSLSSTNLERSAQSPLLPKAQRDILKKASGYLLEAESRRVALPKRKADLEQVEKNIAGLRADVTALGRVQSPAAASMTQRLLDAEDQAKRLRQRIHDLETEAGDRDNQARRELARLTHG